MSKVREIPTGKRTPLYRFFEMLPAMISYGMIILLFVLSAISPILGSAYILLIVIITLVKAIGVAYRVVQGYNTVKKGIGVNWSKRLAELDVDESTSGRVRAALTELLPGGMSSIEDVAAKLGLSRRTLQRKLSEENTTFQK